MAIKFAEGLTLLLLAASMWALGEANRSWGWGSGFNQTGWPQRSGCNNSSTSNSTNVTSKTVVVGGSQNWVYGFNYSDWALQNGPFHLNDTLVFKYDLQPSHNVYLLPNFWSYVKCDMSRAKLVANESQGGGDGFSFVLKRLQPHYFACGVGNGFHCSTGLMKFVVTPSPLGRHH